MNRILIDLSILRHPYCGLGQVAQNYGRWIASHPEAFGDNWQPTLLVPHGYVGRFGTHVRYLQAHDIYRHLPWLMPRFDVWHSIHQLSPFRPAHHTTRRLLTIHDLNFLYEKQGRKQLRYLHRLQRECNSASEICFISEYAKQDALRHLDLQGKPLHVIHNGVETLTEGEQTPPPKVDPSRPFFLSIGVVKAKKNLHTLFPMMDRMKETLIIAGDDTEDYARKLRNVLSYHPNIQIIGTVSNSERRWLYAHCTALLFPSVAEGFGLPVIEAMQWGKPVFCSPCTSLPEIGGDQAFYFPDFDPDTMARTVREGLARFTPQQAQACKEHAARFSYDHHLEQYLNLYKNL